MRSRDAFFRDSFPIRVQADRLRFMLREASEQLALRHQHFCARIGEQVSQPVFARYLNISESTVEKWEAGVKKPSGMAIKLLMIVQKHGLKMLA